MTCPTSPPNNHRQEYDLSSTVSVSFERTTNTERRKLVLLLWKNKPTTNRATYKSTSNSPDRYLFQRDVLPSLSMTKRFLSIVQRKYTVKYLSSLPERKKEIQFSPLIRREGKKLARLFDTTRHEGGELEDYKGRGSKSYPRTGVVIYREGIISYDLCPSEWKD